MGAVAKVLAAGAILFSAVHFWPWEESRVWQAVNLSNLALLLWCPVLLYAMVRRRECFKGIVPHTSVWAYLAIVFMSAAFAGSAGRGISFSVKMGLTFVAGYTVVCAAVREKKNLELIYNVAFAAGAVSVAAAYVTRFGMSSEGFGFHGSAYKYGTYIGVLVPLGACYFFFSGRLVKKVFACGLVVAGLVSAGTLGAAAAIVAGVVAGVVAGAVAAKRGDFRVAAFASLILGVGLVAAVNGAVKEDLRLKEAQSADLRQRYIEWQAEMNMLEERAVVGSGAGSVNDYRSNFYYQLPKLNTLAAFDQNGWLATAAETGVMGLLCFCWVILEYGKRAAALLHRNDTAAVGVSGLAGIAAACAANVFSSVNYNGVLIVFVLVLAIVGASCRLFEEGRL